MDHISSFNLLRTMPSEKPGSGPQSKGAKKEKIGGATKAQANAGNGSNASKAAKKEKMKAKEAAKKAAP